METAAYLSVPLTGAIVLKCIEVTQSILAMSMTAAFLHSDSGLIDAKRALVAHEFPTVRDWKEHVDEYLDFWVQQDSGAIGASAGVLKTTFDRLAIEAVTPRMLGGEPAEHTTNKEHGNLDKHQKGQARKQSDGNRKAAREEAAALKKAAVKAARNAELDRQMQAALEARKNGGVLKGANGVQFRPGGRR
jgi:hypothetical protein